jgi:hypothetical protein
LPAVRDGPLAAGVRACEDRRMPPVLTSLFSSEKGVIGLALIAGATTLAALGYMTIDQWKEYTTYIFGIYAVTKTAQGAASAIASRPAAAPPMTGSTGANSPTTNITVQPPTTLTPSAEAGFVTLKAMVFMALASVIMLVATASLLSSCKSFRGAAGDVADNIVDCLAPDVKAVTDQFEPLLEQVIVRSTAGDGKVDWSSVKSATSSLKTKLGGCVVAAVVTRALKPRSADPNAPQSSPVEASRDDLAAGFEEMRRTLFEGKTFRTADGTL